MRRRRSVADCFKCSLNRRTCPAASRRCVGRFVETGDAGCGVKLEVASTDVTRPTTRSDASFLSILEQLYEGSWNSSISRYRSRYAYRGVSIRTNSLQSSLARLAGSGSDVARIERGVLRSFRKYAQATEVHAADTIWQWLALGQHAGLPTRLLDWTFSPLVALHFATANLADAHEDGEVWCVDFARVNRELPAALRQLLDREQSETFTLDMLEQFQSLDAFEQVSRKDFVVFVEPPSLHPRLVAQHALFSLTRTPTSTLDHWLQRHPDAYRRITVSAASKPEIRDKLDQANINERVLHGGLDGLCHWLARYYTPSTLASPSRRPARRRRGASSR